MGQKGGVDFGGSSGAFLVGLKKWLINLNGHLLEVYVPNFDEDKRLLWDELSGLYSWWNIPCV